MRNSLILVSVFLLFSLKSLATNINFEEDIAKASIDLGQSELVHVSIKLTAMPNDYVYRQLYMWGGDETSPPKKIIKSISILRNGQSLFIPLSAYADLGDPREISLGKLTLREFTLIISGGDAAGSYSATLTFKNNELAKRNVKSSEFPQEVWEETTFSFNHLNN